MTTPEPSALGGRLIFNVGSRRSGTYWLQRIVTTHPAVGAVPSETHLLSHGIAPLLERFQHRDRDSSEVGKVYIPRERLIAALRHLCDTVFAEFLLPGQERVAERTPLHVLHLPLIAEIYPDAKFVHIIRDGRDVARSIAVQDWGPGELAAAAREWRDAVTAGRAASLGSDRYRELRYESLLSDPGDQIAALYRWLDLPTGDAVLERALEESRRPENVDRFGIGGIASQKWRSAFSPRDLRTFMAVAGDLLEDLGYPVEEPAPPRGLLPAIGRRLGKGRRGLG